MIVYLFISWIAVAAMGIGVGIDWEHNRAGGTRYWRTRAGRAQHLLKVTKGQLAATVDAMPPYDRAAAIGDAGLPRVRRNHHAGLTVVPSPTERAKGTSA